MSETELSPEEKFEAAKMEIKKVLDGGSRLVPTKDLKALYAKVAQREQHERAGTGEGWAVDLDPGLISWGHKGGRTNFIFIDEGGNLSKADMDETELDELLDGSKKGVSSIMKEMGLTPNINEGDGIYEKLQTIADAYPELQKE